MGILILWLRGLIYTIAALSALTIAFGAITFVTVMPEIGLPLLILIVAPLMFGVMTEGDS